MLLDVKRDRSTGQAILLSEVARFVVGLLALFAATVFISLAAWATLFPVLLNWEPTVVTSDSMAPTIRRGDVVAVDPGVDSIGKGTVVLFDDPASSGTLLHRVRSIDSEGRLLTKGDANRLPDSTPVDPEQVIGSARLLVPLVGMPVTWAREADWLPVSVFVGVALVVLWCSRWALEPVYNSWPAAAVPRQRQRISFTRRWIPILTLLIAFGALATFVSTSVANFSGQTASGGNRFRAAADFGGGGGSCGVASVSTGTTIGSTLTISHTTAAGSDRLMVVGVSINNDDFETVLGITYNGAAFTFVGQETNADDARVEIWYLVAPATGTHDAVITFSADLTRFAVAGVITFTGVDQATPLGTFASNQATSAGPATVTVPAASGDLVLGVFSGETFDSVAVDPPADEQWNLSEPVGASFEEFGAGATDAGASPNVTISFSLGSNDHWATGGVALKCP